MVDFIARHIGLVPGSLAHGTYAGHDARGHLSRNAQFAAGVEYAHHIAIFNPALLGIQRFKKLGKKENPVQAITVDARIVKDVADEY